MEPSSDAPPSQTTPTAQVELVAQAIPTATPTNAGVSHFHLKVKARCVIIGKSLLLGTILKK